MRGLGVTDQDLLNLPSKTFADRAIKLPDGSIDWRFYGAPSNFWPTPTGWEFVDQASPHGSGIMAWIQANQMIVVTAAGALLLLALMGRRR